MMGRAFKYGDSVDTDVIIPARYCTRYDEPYLGQHCLEDLDPTFVERVKRGDVIIAGANFGCGSSRENAPLAIRGAGVKCVIAKSFARIFFRNSINIGLPIFICPDAVKGISDGDDVEVDIGRGIIINQTTGDRWSAAQYPTEIQEIIASGGLVEFVKGRLDRRGGVI